MCVTDIPHAAQVRNHTRWRPGWNTGRTSYAWLLSLTDQPGLRTLVNQYQYALRDLPGFDLVPLEWLHILLQEVGFTDQVGDDQLHRLVAAVREHLAATPAPTLAFHHAVVLPESLALPAEPQSTVLELRQLIRRTCQDVLGEDAIPPEPEETERYLNIAHSTDEGPAIFAVTALSATPVSPTTAKATGLSLVRLNRDHSNSEWEVVEELPFGG